jgi:hypothetical protein
MSLETAYYISQFVAVAAVLVSLVYLSSQQRQAVKALRAQIHIHRLGFATRDLFHATDPEQARIQLAGFRGDPALTDEQLVQFLSAEFARFMSLEEQFRLRQEGHVDDARWLSTEAGFRRILRFPGVRAVGRMFQTASADKDFKLFLERLMIEGQQIPATTLAGIWRTLAQHEGAGAAG